MTDPTSTTSTTEATLFVSRPAGNIVFLGDPVHDEAGRVFHGPGNGKLFELAVEENNLQGSGPTDYVCTLIDPHSADSRYQFIRKGDQVWLGGVRFDRTDISPNLSAIEIVPVPEVRVPQFLVRSPNGMYICVVNNKYKPSDEKLTMYRITPRGDIVRMHYVRSGWQGGRQLVSSVEGVLDLRPNEEVWTNTAMHDMRMTRLDPNDYTVTEPGDGTITIVPKESSEASNEASRKEKS